MRTQTIEFIVQKFCLFSGFSALDLKFSGVERRSKTELLGESYVMNFSNNKKRSLQLIYYPCPEGRDIFLINIVNEEIEETFNLRNWLKKHDLLENIDQFQLSNHSGNFSDKIDSFINYLNKLLKRDDLNHILKGEAWEKVYFDWAGMR